MSQNREKDSCQSFSKLNSVLTEKKKLPMIPKSRKIHTMRALNQKQRELKFEQQKLGESLDNDHEVKIDGLLMFDEVHEAISSPKKSKIELKIVENLPKRKLIISRGSRTNLSAAKVFRGTASSQRSEISSFQFVLDTLE